MNDDFQIRHFERKQLNAGNADVIIFVQIKILISTPVFTGSLRNNGTGNDQNNSSGCCPCFFYLPFPRLP